MRLIKNLEFPGDDEFLSQINSQLQAVDGGEYIAEASNIALDRMMAQVQRENKWAEVCIVLEKVKLVAKKYQKNIESKPFFYRLFWLRPTRLVDQIKNRLYSQNVTKPFFTALEFDPQEIKIYDYFCLLSTALIFISFLTILLFFVAIFHKFYWFIAIPLFFILLTAVSILTQDKLYKYIILEIVFVNLFERFVEAFNYREQRREEFLRKTYDLPEMIQQKFQENQMESLFLQMDQQKIQEQAKFKEELEQMQLEAAIRLQQFSAILAIKQAKNEEEIKKLRSETRLQDLEAELNIKDQDEAKKSDRRLAFHAIDATQEILVSMSSFLAENNLKDRNVERLLTLMSGLKSKTRTDVGLSDNAFQEFIDQIIDLSDTQASKKKSDKK